MPAWVEILSVWPLVRIILHCPDGDVPNIWRMDNECSGKIKSYFAKHDIKLELAPPRNHRTNRAERWIRTFKNHLLFNDCDSGQRLATLTLGRNLVPSYHLRLGSSTWQIRSECSTHSTCGDKGGHPREAKQTRLVGCTSRSSDIALSLLYMLGYNHRSNSSDRYSGMASKKNQDVWSEFHKRIICLHLRLSRYRKHNWQCTCSEPYQAAFRHCRWNNLCKVYRVWVIRSSHLQKQTDKHQHPLGQFRLWRIWQYRLHHWQCAKSAYRTKTKGAKGERQSRSQLKN